MKMQWVCHDHCDGIAGGYPSFKTGGATRLPCRYALSSPHKCNPSCFDGR